MSRALGFVRVQGRDELICLGSRGVLLTQTETWVEVKVVDGHFDDNFPSVLLLFNPAGAPFVQLEKIGTHERWWKSVHSNDLRLETS